jgi:predicted DNA binding CopG/RHH family protein
MKEKPATMPVFKSESDEADWWASAEGRQFVKHKSAEAAGKKREKEGSPLIARLNKTSSIQIALRLPETDLAQARRLAKCKGIGYQTLLKMLVHEGLQREARRNRT